MSWSLSEDTTCVSEFSSCITMRVMEPRYSRESTSAPMNPSPPMRSASGRITTEVTASGACAEIGTLAPLSSTKAPPSFLPRSMFDSPMKSAANRLAGFR